MCEQRYADYNYYVGTSPDGAGDTTVYIYRLDLDDAYVLVSIYTRGRKTSAPVAPTMPAVTPPAEAILAKTPQPSAALLSIATNLVLVPAV